MVLFGCPTTRKASLPTSLIAYKVTYSGATRKPCKFSWGYVQIFRTVPSAHTLVRWEDENAFASIVQARPDPIFGRPVHQRVAPSITARYFSSCPSDSTSQWTPCPPAASSANRPARHYPRFWIWRPSSERQWDLNPPDLSAARRTLWLLLTSAEHEGTAFQLPCTGFRPVRDDRPPRVIHATFIPYTRRIYSHTLWIVIGL